MAGSATQDYVYDGNQLLLIRSATDGVLDRFLPGPAGEPVAQETFTGVSSNGTNTYSTHWLLADNEGSIRMVVDSQGHDLGDITYDSFGNVTSAATPASAGSVLGYAGMQYDAATKLNYAGARYYDPSTGRFLSPDPIGFQGGDKNLYRYVGNDPINAVDPSGLNTSVLGGSIYSGGGTGSSYGVSSIHVGNGPQIIHGVPVWNSGSTQGGSSASGLRSDSPSIAADWDLTVNGTHQFPATMSGPTAFESETTRFLNNLPTETEAKQEQLDYQAEKLAEAKSVDADNSFTQVRQNFVSSGHGYIVASIIAGANTAGELVGVGGVWNGVSGKGYIGNRLSPGERALDFTLGSVQLASTASGLYSIGSAGLSFAGRAASAEVTAPSSGTFSDLLQSGRYLKQQGFDAAARREILSSFEPGTVRFGTTTADEAAYRFFSDPSRATGRYLTSEFTTDPVGRLALPAGNNGSLFQQFVIPEGTSAIRGTVGPNFGLPGGGGQIFISNPGVLRPVPLIGGP